MLGVGLGCGALLLVGLFGAAGVAYSYWQQTQVLSAQLALAEAAAAVAKNAPAPSVTVTQPVGDCKKAYECCVAITTKAASADLAAQCEAFKLVGRAEGECSTALDGYRKVAKTQNLICD